MLTIKTWTRGSETVPAIDGRELHKALEVGRDLSTWLNDRIKAYGHIDGEDFTTYLVPRGAGTPAKEWLITLPMSAELCLLDRSEKGMGIRRSILEQQSVQNRYSPSKNTEICTDSKPIWELTLDDLQSNRESKTHEVETVEESPWIECLIKREGGVTHTTVGAYGTVITFRPDRLGRSIARVDDQLHRKQLIKSIFYRQILIDSKGE